MQVPKTHRSWNHFLEEVNRKIFVNELDRDGVRDNLIIDVQNADVSFKTTVGALKIMAFDELKAMDTIHELQSAISAMLADPMDAGACLNAQNALRRSERVRRLGVPA